LNSDLLSTDLPSPDLDPAAAVRLGRAAHAVLMHEAALQGHPVQALVTRLAAAIETPVVVLAAVVYLLWAFRQAIELLG
jgi:hypothetical protein